MNAPVVPPAEIAIPIEFQSALEAQRAAYFKDPDPTLAARVADIKALTRLVRDNKDAIAAAINADYGCRSTFETMFGEVFVTLDAAHDAIKRLKGWMRPRRRRVDHLMFPGARNRVIPQPLGVVGVIVPWNYPIMLSMGPLISIFAAGNRAMVKMSHNSRHLAALLTEISPRYLASDKLVFFDDGEGHGPAFSSLSFDHLIFTGSTATGRAVMANAARNLTPVTLELGGKSPAIVAPDFPLKTAAERILWAKTFNAGQTCLAVDHAFLPRGKEDAFVAECLRLTAKRYPDINGPDFTSIIDDRAYERLSNVLEDARAKGARVINLAEGQTPDVSTRKLAPHIVMDVTPDMQLMQREIFGPILPVRLYDQPQEVADAINSRDRPLAIYPFTRDSKTRDFYLTRVMSGGVSVNDAILHVTQHDLPFGGVGSSGMGHYHGREGFDTFSKLRPVFEQGPISSVQMLMQPPYSRMTRRMIDTLMWLRGRIASSF
jgi:coniferyl-aldehyde dehydrogenase